MKEELSPVMQHMTGVWENCCKGIGHSRLRINQSMHQALALAVSSGFKFAFNDFAEAVGKFRGGYWIGEAESFYALAVTEGNRSAAIAFERWNRRKPFVTDQPGKKNERLYVGARFMWQGELATVTSFANDGESLIACTYQEHLQGKSIKHRYAVTRKDLAADRKERKERRKMREELNTIAFAADEGTGENKMAAKIVAALGAASTAKFDSLPIEKVRKVWAMFKSEALFGKKEATK